jgi:hypothetical protein
MSSEWHWITAAIVAGALLGGWLFYQLMRQRSGVLEYVGNDRVAPLPRVRIPELHGDTRQLPSLAERTMMLRALRDMCEKCGTDHVGDCAPPVTGVVVAPEVAAMAVAPPVLVPAEPDYGNWTWIGGTLVPPHNLVVSLPAGDWLRDLLVA